MIYAAGSDSTLALIQSFFLAMTLNPEVQRKAQEEIDRVVGRDRLPTFEDRAQLQYLECVIREIYRWNPAAPLGVAHRLTQDDVYEGHLIPEGTTVIPNIWAMLHDPEMYPDPLAFNPDRFEHMSRSEFKQSDPRNFMFGFGRRICVGQHFADNVVFCVLASVLATLDVREKVGADGKQITPEVEYPQFVGRPKAYECDIQLRSEKAGSLIDAAVEEERSQLDGYEVATS